MLPRIEAQEKLAAINVAALAAGAGEPLDRQRIFAELERKASGADRQRARAAKPDDLAGMGIGIVFEDAESEPVSAASEPHNEGVNHA